MILKSAYCTIRIIRRNFSARCTITHELGDKLAAAPAGGPLMSCVGWEGTNWLFVTVQVKVTSVCCDIIRLYQWSRDPVLGRLQYPDTFSHYFILFLPESLDKILRRNI